MTLSQSDVKVLREALAKGIELLEPWQATGLLGEQALDQHRAALAILDAQEAAQGVGEDK